MNNINIGDFLFTESKEYVIINTYFKQAEIISYFYSIFVQPNAKERNDN